MTEDLPYAQGGQNDYKWTDRAFELLGQGLLSVNVVGADDHTAVQAIGQCPRCDHDVAYTRLEKLVIPKADSLGLQKVDGSDEPAYVAIEVLCWCLQEHPGRPTNVSRGCGITFSTEVLVRSV